MEKEKEYYLIRHKFDHELFVHHYDKLRNMLILKQMDIETVVLELKPDALLLIDCMGQHNQKTLELYPINDYIANRKVNPKANHNG